MSAWNQLGYHPSIHQIFARLWLGDLARAAGRPLTLAEVPDAELDRLAELGFDLLYLMGVWTLGAEGRRIARSQRSVVAGYDALLPDWTEDDVIGSPFAVARYAVDPSLGGDAALATLRARLAARGIGLILDYVPNHVARDHHWIDERPEIFLRDKTGRVLEGKDPYFPPWTDTAQLDYRLRATRRTAIEALVAVSERCDGVRCDMAMLMLDSVFRRAWGSQPKAAGAEEAKGEFWAEAIDEVRRTRPDFLFVAEAYWDLEWRLQMLGFDYTYDKSLYDRLIGGSAGLVRAHLGAGLDYQRRSVRFVENHDEARLATALPRDRARAAAVIAATVPGMRFFHEGQLEGRKVRASVHLGRRQAEPVDAATLRFHEALLRALKRPALRQGSFATLSARAAAAHNASFEALVAHRWDHREGAVVVVVNFGSSRAQGRITLDLWGLGGRPAVLRELLEGSEFRRDGDELVDPNGGLFVDLPAYGVHLFAVERG